jgi:para-aminobenzoate synthetase component I
MYRKADFNIYGIDNLGARITLLIEPYQTGCFFSSHHKVYPSHKNSFSSYDYMAAFGTIDECNSVYNHTLPDFDTKLAKGDSWYFGFFSYDFKNRIEQLNSNNIDFHFWPDFYFFKPEVIILVKKGTMQILAHLSSNKAPKDVWNDLISLDPANNKYGPQQPVKMVPRMSKVEYLSKVQKIKQHILRGDIYETNFCQEFYSYGKFDPYQGFLKLCHVSPSPFSCLFRLKEKYLLSASPERFLKKEGKTIISQPIKGTTRRSENTHEDNLLKQKLQNNKKERAENIMIVDLVRNDLSKVALKGSVNVDELCGIYSFKHVSHLISTISAITHETSFDKIIRATFPMGSMTGAPKIKAMRLAEKYESTKRGLYSGAVGYISPDMDFDFNVVIRSLQYNAENNYLSYMVGGAITSLSDPENEYEECLIKANAIKDTLKSS